MWIKTVKLKDILTQYYATILPENNSIKIILMPHWLVIENDTFIPTPRPEHLFLQYITWVKQVRSRSLPRYKKNLALYGATWQRWRGRWPRKQRRIEERVTGKRGQTRVSQIGFQSLVRLLQNKRLKDWCLAFSLLNCQVIIYVLCCCTRLMFGCVRKVVDTAVCKKYQFLRNRALKLLQAYENCRVEC